MLRALHIYAARPYIYMRHDLTCLLLISRHNVNTMLRALHVYMSYIIILFVYTYHPATSPHQPARCPCTQHQGPYIYILYTCCIHIIDTYNHTYYIFTFKPESQPSLLHNRTAHTMRGGGLGSRPQKMYGERLGDGVEYHLMSPTPRR